MFPVTMLQSRYFFPFLQHLGDAPTSVRHLLFGSNAEAERAVQFGSAPGECGTDEPALLYMSGFESLGQPLHQELHRLITRRSYVDTLGRRWHLSSATWLFAAINTTTMIAGSDLLNMEHWLCTSFQHIMQIDTLRDPASLWEVCEKIAVEFDRKVEQRTDAVFYRAVCGTPGRLCAIRRWITNASLATTPGDTISLKEIEEQMLAEIGTVLEKLPYREQVISISEFEEWASQFGDDNLEFQEPAYLMRRHLSFPYPLVDSIFLGPRVLGDLIY